MGAWRAKSVANVAVGVGVQALSDIITPTGKIHSFLLQSDDGNSGNIFVGDSDVATGGGEGGKLTAGQSYTSPASEKGLDISTFNVVASAANQTMRVLYWESGSLV